MSAKLEALIIMQIEEYYSDFMSDIVCEREGFSEETFTEKMCDFLVDHAVIDNYTCSSFIRRERGIKVNAWNFDEENGVLTLVVAEFNKLPQLKTISKSEIIDFFKRPTRFFESCFTKKFCEVLDEAEPAYGLVTLINQNHELISGLKIILLTNSIISDRATIEHNGKIGKVNCTYDVWDISRFFMIESSQKAREDIVVTFEKYDKEGIPCLSAFGRDNGYESYLMVFPGELVAELYDNYGERLLEQNVRTFLQFKSKVNRGLKVTIQNFPHMFFAYNNGLTVTAEKVETNHMKNRVISVTNLQIVNGGQTTASIYTAMKRDKASLDNIYVQVKLTVIPEDKVEELIPKISEYANTQNKVNAADFYSNHPFHLRVEEISRRVPAPSKDGSMRDPFWFYERTRGQYANAISRLTLGEAAKFKIRNPRNQMFNKTDLAKYENSWRQMPHIVSRGAQKNFCEFANEMAKEWEKNSEFFNELYFKNMISKALIFKFIDNLVANSTWYSGGYKANVVTYSMAKLSSMLANRGIHLDPLKIWQRQELSIALKNQLAVVAETVNREIQNTPSGISNISEWCKKEACWQLIKAIDIPLNEEILTDCVEHEEVVHREKYAKKDQRINDGISVQTYVLELGKEYWQHVAEWGATQKCFFRSQKDLDILQLACMIPAKVPSEKQAKIW